MKKVIIFDFDGVIVNSPAVAAQDLMERYPKLTGEIQKKILEGNFHVELKKFKQAHGYKDLTGREAEEHKRAYIQKKLAAEPYSGIIELLQKLQKEGYVLVLNTSAWGRNVLPLLEKYDLSKYFDFLATAELSINKVEKFKLIGHHYNIPTINSLFVTDTLGDLRESEVAGVPTICITWGAHEKEYFLREPHANLIGIANNTDELLKEIKSHFS